MARERLTNKTAEDWMKSKPGTQVQDKGTGIDNDPYAMNNPDHEKNDPKYDAYSKGDPSAWAEDVDESNLWKKDKRDGMHVPEMTSKQAAEAVAAAKKLEEKAIKCIVASQRMLPGASDELIEAQAADFMHLPENAVNATLNRQEKLAQFISKAAEESEGESEEESEGESEEEKKKEVEAKEEEKKAPAEGDEEVEAKEEASAEGDEEEAPAEGDEEEASAEEDEMGKMASAIISGDISKLPPALQEAINKKKEKKKEEEEAIKKKKEKSEDKGDKEEEEAGKSCEASESSLLDEIFSSVTASDSKKGAKTLKGMVKKEASEGANSLDGLWGGAPDVSKVFK